jgi:hypothetical protein
VYKKRNITYDWPYYITEENPSTTCEAFAFMNIRPIADVSSKSYTPAWKDTLRITGDVNNEIHERYYVDRFDRLNAIPKTVPDVEYINILGQIGKEHANLNFDLL